MHLRSGAVDGLGSFVESRALLDRDETLQAELLPGLLHGHCPALDVGVGLLAISTRLFRHDFAILVLGQIVLGEATGGLRLAAAEHDRLAIPALGNLRNFHRLHGLHGFHCLHGLHCLHGFHCLHRLHGGLHNLHWERHGSSEG